MGINNRIRRKRKKAKEAARKNRRREQSMLETKALVPAHESDGLAGPLEAMGPERETPAIDRLLENGEETYREALSEVGELLRLVDPLSVLSRLTYYDLLFGDNRIGGMKDSDSEWTVPEFHVEMLQALWLRVGPDELSGEPPQGDLTEQIRDNVGTLCYAWLFRGANPSAADLPDGEKAVAFVQSLLSNATEIVRVRSYRSQTRRILRELYEPFDARLLETRGFDASDIPDVFSKLYTEVQSREKSHLGTLVDLFERSGTDKRLLARNYHELLGSEEEEAERFMADPRMNRASLEDLRVLVMDHHDRLLPEVYTFSASDLAEPSGPEEERVSAILDGYALAWGDLAGHDSGYFHRSNPVWRKPLVRLEDGRYFCALPGVFFSFPIPCMEAVLSSHMDEVKSRRAEYLGFKVAEIVDRHFPGCNIRRNVRWTVDGETLEADLVARIDSLALVIECVSEKITPSELGDEPERLREHVEELLVGPSRKSLRLKKRLEATGSRPDMAEPLSGGIGKVRKALRVSVCLEDFGFIRSTLRLLGDVGWLPEDFAPSPTMNLADFEMAFDLLGHPVRILHYLSRREAIEGNVGYLADGHDLLGLYLTTLLDTDDAGLDIVPGMNELSAPLDTYYRSLDMGVTAEKPRPAITPLFASVFAQLQREGIDRWPEIGVALGRFSPGDQKRVSKTLARLRKGVHRNWKWPDHRNTAICIPSAAPDHALGYVMFRDGNADGMHGFMEQAASAALASGDVRTAVVIARNIDRDDVAYDAIALHEAPVEPKPGDCK